MAAELAPGNTDQLAGRDGRIELLEIEQMLGDGGGILIGLAAGASRAVIDQAAHTLLDETAGFGAHRDAIQAGLFTARRDRFSEEHDGANNLLVVLDGIKEAELELAEVGGSRIILSYGQVARSDRKETIRSAHEQDRAFV